MYDLTVRDHMMIAHSLDHPAFGPAQRLHGATYVVELTCWRSELSAEAIVLDIGAAQEMLRAALSDLNYSNLDEHPELAGQLTTTEVLARFVAERVLTALPPHHGLDRVRVVLREHPDAWAGYTVDL